MISIGTVFGGPGLEHARIRPWIMAAMKAAADLRDASQYQVGPALNVVFHVPGEFCGPDWAGLRDGKYSPRRKLLMVQVAVPENIVDDVESRRFVSESLHRANLIAVQFFRRHGIEFPLREAEQLVMQIKERLDVLVL